MRVSHWSLTTFNPARNTYPSILLQERRRGLQAHPGVHVGLIDPPLDGPRYLPAGDQLIQGAWATTQFVHFCH
jgi:hypothetical protein